MNNPIRHSKVKVVNPITRLPTEQMVAKSLRERNDLTQGKLFLRCSIQNWERFIKLCDEQLGIELLRFTAMLIADVIDEYGTSDCLLCQSDNDNFTIIDTSTAIPKMQEHLQKRFTTDVLAKEPVYIRDVKKQVDGDKIPASLRLVTRIITADDFFQAGSQQTNAS
jgi:hypothetical protein